MRPEAGSILEQIVEKRRERVADAASRIPASALYEKIRDLPCCRDFETAITNDAKKTCAIIAEIKRASPSKGEIRMDLVPETMAAAYERGGASAISVLTEPDFFSGSPEDLIRAKGATTLPVLRKDFIVTDYQVLESAAMGADAILLIARILSEETLLRLSQLAQSFGLGILYEIHDPAELPPVLACGPKVVGINNRNLATFATDITIAPNVAARLPGGITPAALSGIRTPQDIAESREKGLHTFLIGEHLVKAEDPADLLRRFKTADKKETA